VSRGLKTTIAILFVLVVLGVITLPSLRQAIQRISHPPRTEEQARRDVMQVPISTPTDVKVRAQMYWLSATSPASLEAITIDLALSADPVERAKQLLVTLITSAPTPKQQTLPPDTTLLAFYLQPDGTAIADFSDALSAGTPSGILSEQLVEDSIAKTLAANLDAIRQLKILIHGQEAETLAGHLDLSGLFPVSAPAPVSSTTPAPTTPAATATGPSKPAPPAAPSTLANQAPH
jgi:Sporulation and spore germination